MKSLKLQRPGHVSCRDARKPKANWYNFTPTSRNTPSQFQRLTIYKRYSDVPRSISLPFAYFINQLKLLRKSRIKTIRKPQHNQQKSQLSRKQIFITQAFFQFFDVYKTKTENCYKSLLHQINYEYSGECKTVYYEQCLWNNIRISFPEELFDPSIWSQNEKSHDEDKC